MAYKIISIPFDEEKGEFEEDKLVKFMQEVDVRSMSESFFSPNPQWGICFALSLWLMFESLIIFWKEVKSGSLIHHLLYANNVR